MFTLFLSSWKSTVFTDHTRKCSFFPYLEKGNIKNIFCLDHGLSGLNVIPYNKSSMLSVILEDMTWIMVHSIPC